MSHGNGHRRQIAAIDPPAGKIEGNLIAMASAGALLIFAFDSLVPLGVAVPMGYVAIVLLALRSDQRWLTACLAGAGLLLTVGGYFIWPAGNEALGLVNRSLALVVIAVTAALVMLTQDARKELHTLRQFLLRCASCKKIKDERGDWNELEQFLEQRTDLLFSHVMCPLCVEKWYPELHPELQLRHPELFESQPN